MLSTPAARTLWEHLVQWQPATAADLAIHLRAMPDDWPLRLFDVGRPDAALALPPGAEGEQYPDRAPEIAPYDDISSFEDCPACGEVGDNCRFHTGHAAGHREAIQPLHVALKARPDMTLREFAAWQADVSEAQDYGSEPPALPVAVSSAPADDLPARLRTALTEQFTERGNPFSEMRRHEKGPDGWPASHPVGPHQVAEVLRELLAAVQPAPAETDEERTDREETERDHAKGDHTHCGVTCETEVPTEHLRNFVIAKGYPGTKGALDELLRRARAERPLSPYYEHPACGFHWHGRDGMDIPVRDGQPVCPRCELRRLADVAQQAEPCEQHPTAPTFDGKCGGCTQYPADMIKAQQTEADRG